MVLLGIHSSGHTALVRVNALLNAQHEILINITGGIFQHDNARLHTA